MSELKLEQHILMNKLIHYLNTKGIFMLKRLQYLIFIYILFWLHCLVYGCIILSLVFQFM
jgi:hypothetical protein